MTDEIEVILLATRPKKQNSFVEVPKVLREKFPNSNITQIREKGEILWKVQSQCGSACDDRGSYYNEKGEFIRANSWRPLSK